MQISATPKVLSPVPWRKILGDTVDFIKQHSSGVAGFSAFFFLLNIPDQLELLDFNDLNPSSVWLYVSLILLFLAISYFVFVTFILWIANQLQPTARESFS